MTEETSQEKTLEELKKEAEEYLAGWKRAKADLVNFQKQVERERAEWFAYANAGCVKALLPVLDSLEMAVAPTPPSHPPEPPLGQGGKDGGRGMLSSARGGNETISPPLGGGVRGGSVDGIEKIRDQMFEALKSMGVEAIAVAKEPPNPELHEVVGVERVDEVSSGLMAREVQRGYTMHGKVLRAAKVIIAE